MLEILLATMVEYPWNVSTQTKGGHEMSKHMANSENVLLMHFFVLWGGTTA